MKTPHNKHVDEIEKISNKKKKSVADNELGAARARSYGESSSASENYGDGPREENRSVNPTPPIDNKRKLDDLNDTLNALNLMPAKKSKPGNDCNGNSNCVSKYYGCSCNLRPATTFNTMTSANRLSSDSSDENSLEFIMNEVYVHSSASSASVYEQVVASTSYPITTLDSSDDMDDE